MSDLDDYRIKINKIDDEMSKLFVERMEVSKDIADYKLKHALPIYDENREKEVIEYICEGLTNGEISKMLDVSVNTVKVHVSSIIQKLGVEDRTQVVVKAFKSFSK